MHTSINFNTLRRGMMCLGFWLLWVYACSSGVQELSAVYEHD